MKMEFNYELIQVKLKNDGFFAAFVNLFIDNVKGIGFELLERLIETDLFTKAVNKFILKKLKEK
jgi:hypothetical protein